MSNSSRLAALAGLSLSLILAPAASADAGPSRVRQERVAQRGSEDPVAIQVAQTQRVIRDAMLEASLTSSQLTDAYGVVETFVRNYVGAVEAGDPVVTEHTFQEIFEGKVGQRLQGKYSLTASEIDFLRERTQEWVDGTLLLNAGGAQ